MAVLTSLYVKISLKIVIKYTVNGPHFDLKTGHKITVKTVKTGLVCSLVLQF